MFVIVSLKACLFSVSAIVMINAISFFHLSPGLRFAVAAVVACCCSNSTSFSCCFRVGRLRWSFLEVIVYCVIWFLLNIDNSLLTRRILLWFVCDAAAAVLSISFCHCSPLSMLSLCLMMIRCHES